MIRKVTLVALLVVALVGLNGCRTAPIQDVPSTPVPTSTATMESVEKAIMTAGYGLGWSMKRVRPGLIEGTLLLRKHRAVVEIPYSASSYSISYKDSSELNYSPTNRTIHSNYNGWIQNLDNAIRGQLAMI
jgi:hypothetical protein